MGPKKSKRKGRNQDDDQFQNQQIVSKWAQALENHDDDEPPDAEQLYAKPGKEIFDFDFSHQKALDMSSQPPKPQRDKYADFNQEELEQLKKAKEKAKIDKGIKNQMKNEKKKQRQKEVEAQKLVELAEKEKMAEQAKKVEEEIKKQKKQEASPWTIPLGLLLFLIIMLFLQYNKEIYERLSKFKTDDIDFYQILEADQSATQKQLKNKYKKLVLKYHPDRNPDCQFCKQKFDNIMRAWEVLGEPEKRKQYDQNSGFIAELKSASTTLTPHNYNYLVEESSFLWLIQVFDSTNSYSRYFAQFWEEAVNNYGDFVKFGRVDIWHQTDMTSYIPYKFQVFPSVYFLDQGYSQICSFNFERPLEGLKKCIEEALERHGHEKKLVKQIPARSLPKSKHNKMEVYLDGKLRANIRIKAYNRMMDRYFDFYFLEEDTTQKQAVVLLDDAPHTFNFSDNSKKTYESYSLFLQSFVIQEVSTCAFLHRCEQRPCILVLNRTKLGEITPMLPLRKHSLEKMPVFLLSDGLKDLEAQINMIKQPFENFEIGVYSGGRIDLGYVDEADLLSPDQGERLYLECRITNWKDAVFQHLTKITEMVLGK